MQINVTFRKTDPVESLRVYAQEKLKKLNKYFDVPVQAHVVLSVEKYRHIADVTLNVDGTVIKAMEETEDMYSTIDLVLDKLEAQVRKYLTRMRDKRIEGSRQERGEMYTGEEGREEPLIEEEVMAVKPMDPVEAAQQLDLSGMDFLVFRDSRTQEVCVIYRKKSGNFGLIVPQA